MLLCSSKTHSGVNLYATWKQKPSLKCALHLTVFAKCAPFCLRFDLKRTPVGRAPWRFILTWVFVMNGRQWPLKELTVIVIGTISAFKKITFTKAHHQKIFHNIYPSSFATPCYPPHHIYHIYQSFLKCAMYIFQWCHWKSINHLWPLTIHSVPLWLFSYLGGSVQENHHAIQKLF